MYFPYHKYFFRTVVKGPSVQFEHFSFDRKFERRNACSLNSPVLDGYFSSYLEQMLIAVQRGWMVQLVGEAGSGKSSLIQFCADLYGKELHMITLSSRVRQNYTFIVCYLPGNSGIFMNFALFVGFLENFRKNKKIQKKNRIL